MALHAAPLSAPGEEQWLRALAGTALPWYLLTAPEALFDRGVEELIRAADLPGASWVAQLDGDEDDIAYALDVLGIDATHAGSSAVVLGPGVARAAAAAVDAAAGGSHHRLLLLQVDAARLDSLTAALAAGDTAAAARMSRLVLVRDAAQPWAVVAAPVELLRRVTAPAAPVRLPARAESPHPHLHLHPPALHLAPTAKRLPGRLGAVVASVLIAAVAATSAAVVIARHQPAQLGASTQAGHPSTFPAIPPPRTATMAATWDRTAQVVLFGGATPSGSGHGSPLGDTWRGALPPDAAWQRVAPAPLQPVPRLAGAMAADVTDGYVLLFGGETYGDQGLQDTWTYAGGWAQLAPRDAPPGGPALAATEPSTGRVLLVTTCCALAAVPTGERMQTWRWTGGDWTLLGPAPGWVTTAALVSDPWNGTVVMVADGGSQRAATYVWDGTGWSAAGGVVEPPVTPGRRPSLAYDPGTHAVLDVVGGESAGHRTWRFTPAYGWSEQLNAAAPPVVGLVLDEPVEGSAMLYGGLDQPTELTQRWFWSEGTWTESLQPPPLAALPAAGFGAAVAADPQSGGLVLFGGHDASDQTWVWSAGGWSLLFFTAPIPPPRLGASMAYDSTTRTALLVGGQLDDGALAGDMWQWRGDQWLRLHVSGVPPPTVDAPLAWDAARHQAVLLVADPTSPLPTADTWTWDESTGQWTEQHPPTSPPLRAESSLTFDPATGDVMLVVPCCAGAVEQLSETWTWDGTTWSRRQTLHQPPIHATVTADPARHRTLLVAACCGGFDPSSTIGPPQTWSWDGNDWTRIAAAPLPALQDVAALVTDARGNPELIARVAGAGPRHPLDGLWQWTGARWLRLV